MKGEIDKDFYCSAGIFDNGNCEIRAWSSCYSLCSKEMCSINSFHRKYPTPEQFKEEYGKEWDGACYKILNNDDEWSELTFDRKLFNKENIKVVCACTPWGKPPDGWRP